MQTLSIIGCGKVGKTLGFLFAKSNTFKIQDILSTSFENALSGKNFIGQGSPICDYSQLTPTSHLLLGAQDENLAQIIDHLNNNDSIFANTIIFHCSGALTSEILQPLKNKGITIASVHPFKSFSHPEDDIYRFHGTYCTVEGDTLACQSLTHAFKNIGANVVNIKSENKTLVHIATIFTSNYFVTLIESALQLLEQGGIDKKLALEMIEPLLLGTYESVKKLGTVRALTGPIARGDAQVIENQCRRLSQLDDSFLELYQMLGRKTLELAIAQNNLSDSQIEKLAKALNISS